MTLKFKKYPVRNYSGLIEPIRDARQIPGYLNVNVLDLVGDRISRLNDNATVLEIGSLYGRLTWEILSRLPTGGFLTVVESFHLSGEQKIDNLKRLPSSDNWHFPKINVSHRNIWDIVMRQHENFENLKLHAMKSIDFMKSGRGLRPWDLVWLDGCHRYHTVFSELEYFSRLTKEIWGDDYVVSTLEYLQVKSAVDDWYNKNKEDWDLNIHCGSIFQLIKKT